MALDREESHEESHDDEFEAVDLESYKAELKEMMKAVAQGIGNTPVSVLVEEGSVFLKVYEVEIVRIKKEKEEEKMKNMKKIEEERESNKSLKKGEVMASPKKIKKKNSFDFLNFCACSGKQFVEHN
ncbi:hypothetical protein BVRB_4g081900 [Beta vulgaris subsp. vulgaris]|nr:hypothetical protein BVRB_4g081900 [Beta vulgaris subsp. vulgaris]